MDISELRLREIILSALRNVQAEELAAREKQLLYMIAEDHFHSDYEDFLRQKQLDRYSVTIIIPEEWKQQGYVWKLTSIRKDVRILTRVESQQENLNDSVTVFPVASRSFAAKLALGITDTFTTEWVVRCMEAGSSVLLLTQGLRKFTGREPQAYSQRVLNYYRMLLEYGIQIGSLDELTTNTKEEMMPVNVTESFSAKPAVLGIPRKKQLITCADLYNYLTGGVIVLYDGDRITDLAKERASTLGIEVRRGTP